MGNLVPEKRLDKNNRLVTRHVRSNDGDNPTTALPAPVINPASGSRESLLQSRTEAREAIEDHDDHGLMDGGYRYDFLGSIHLLDEKTARLIKESVTTPHMATLCFYLLVDYSDQMIRIREVLHYRDAIEFTKDLAHYNFSDDCMGVTRGIREMREFQNFDDLTELPEEKQRQVSALMRVGYSVYLHLGAKHPSLAESCQYGLGSQYPLRIKDDELVELVMKNPEQDHLICSLIASRKALDLSLIREAIKNANALTAGSL